MEVKVYFSLRDGSAFAEAVYDGDKTIVKAGGKISKNFASYIRGGTLTRNMRSDPQLVDGDRNIIADCIFTSPSTAAQFVGGRSFNGYEAWKVEKHKNLGTYLRENGLK